MRWIRLNWILLASFAILSATKAESSRQKRDLSYVKNFIKTAIFGRENKTSPELVLVNSNENYKIFRIPGFNNILVKAVPKVPGAADVPEKVELISPEDSKISIVASYLGTKTQGETLNALEGVKALLSSGVLTATKDQADPIGPLPPHLQLIAVGEGSFEKPHILMDTSTICGEVQAEEKPSVVQQSTIWQGHPFLSIFQRPISFPTILKPVVPVNAPFPALPTKYSYKQIHGDGKVTTYSANDDHNVIVTQSDPLPPVVTYRIQEVMNMGVHGLHGLTSIPVLAGNIQRPLVQYFTSPKVNPYRPVVSSVGNNYSYKQIHNDGMVTSYTSGQEGRDVVVTEGAKVPAIPSFITDRIEKVVTSAALGKQPNPMLLSELQVAQTQWYKPVVNGHQMIDTKGGVQVNVDTKEQQHIQNINTGSQGTYSYQTIHKDGSVTNQKADSLVSFKPGKVKSKPMYPVFIEDRLQTIAKTSDGPFSYKMIHNDGSVTNYGVFGVHKGKSRSQIVPNQQANFIFTNQRQAFKPEMKERDTGYSYKRIHSDGTVTTYSSNGVIEENGTRPVNRFQADDIQMINNGKLHTNLNKQQNMGIILHDTLQKNDQQVSNAAKDAKNQRIANDTKSNTFSFNQKNFQAPHIGNSSPGSFTYKAVHSDGSMTIYSQNGVKEINNNKGHNKMRQSLSAPEPNILENNIVEEFDNQKLKQNGQVSSHTSLPASGLFSYKTIHNDGSSTIFSQHGNTEKKAPLKIKSQPMSTFASVDQQGKYQYSEGVSPKSALSSQVENNIKISTGTDIGSGSGSSSYKTILSNVLSTNSQNGVKEGKVFVINEKLPSSLTSDGNLSENNQYIEGNTLNYALNGQAGKQNIQLSLQNNFGSGSSSYSYKTIHNDGSTTIYSQNGVKEENIQFNNENKPSSSAAILNEPANFQDFKFNANSNTLDSQTKKQNIHVISQSNVGSKPGSFVYKTIHSDGSTTIYLQNGVKEENAAIININEQESGSKDLNHQNVHVNPQNIVIPVSGSFSYKNVHGDGSATIYSQNGIEKDRKMDQKLSSIELGNQYDSNHDLQANAQNNVGLAFTGQKMKQNIQKHLPSSTPGSFSYKIVHNDGSTTIYSPDGIKVDDVPFKNKNLQSMIVAGDNQQRNNQNIQMSAQNIAVPVAGAFSYKVVNHDGSTTTYTQNGIKQEAGAKESHVEENTEHINKAQQFGNDVKINMNEHHLHTNQQNKGTSTHRKFLYNVVHRDGSETNNSGQGVNESKNPNRNNSNYSQSQQPSSIKKYEVTEKNNVHINPQYKSKPSGSFSYKSIHSDGSGTNMQGGLSQQNVQNQDKLLSKNLNNADEKIEQKSNQIIPPAPQLPEETNNDLSVTPVSVLVADSNKVLFTKPVVSSYTYKQISHNSPDQFKVAVNIGDAATKEVQVVAGANTNDAAAVDTIPKDYVYIPPANVNEPPPIKPLVSKEEKSGIKQNAPVVVLAPVEEVPCTDKSLSEHPIVVLDEPMQYSYEQRKTDGSAIHVESDQSVVSVNISAKAGGNRGDIPESP